MDYSKTTQRLLKDYYRIPIEDLMIYNEDVGNDWVKIAEDSEQFSASFRKTT